jgi:CheY-like chemotaxis protein
MAKIVILEDDSMIGEIYKKKFGDSGFEVFLVPSGEQVLSLVENNPDISVAMLDLMIPKMGGIEVLKKLRSGDYNPDLKIIICTNNSSQEEKDKATEAGANGFIVKANYTPSQLVEEVNRLLGQYAEQKKNEAREALGGSTDADSNQKKILMIEDEEVFIDMFGERLKKEGFSVTFARNGAWGVKEALKSKYDLFVIDMVMPAMTGEEIIEKLKMEDETKNLPIIVISASVDEVTARRVKEMGVNEFFEKTKLTPTELANKAAELLK